MKKYLFGLSAMLVGTGLMFVLMHGEVRAEVHPEAELEKVSHGLDYFKFRDVSCVRLFDRSISCVKS